MCITQLEDCNNMVAETPLKISASKKKAKIFWGGYPLSESII
jgi:hypothetical protein